MPEQSDQERLVEIVRALLKRTNDGLATWSPTDEDDTFLFRSGRQSLTIRYSVAWGYRVTLLDEYGRMLVQLQSEELPDPTLYEDLKVLYETARRSALKIDDKLDSFLEELNPAFEVRAARYGAGDVYADVTETVQAHVVNDHLEIDVTNEALLGDPVVDVVKELVINFAVRGTPATRTFPEGTHVALP